MDALRGSAVSVLHGMLDKRLDLQFCCCTCCLPSCCSPNRGILRVQVMDIPDLEAAEDITRQVSITFEPHRQGPCTASVTDAAA